MPSPRRSTRSVSRRSKRSKRSVSRRSKRARRSSKRARYHGVEMIAPARMMRKEDANYFISGKMVVSTEPYDPDFRDFDFIQRLSQEDLKTIVFGRRHPRNDIVLHRDGREVRFHTILPVTEARELFLRPLGYARRGTYFENVIRGIIEDADQDVLFKRDDVYVSVKDIFAGLSDRNDDPIDRLNY